MRSSPKLLTAIVFAASVLTAGKAARAQYVSLDTGRTFNNPASAWLDTRLLGVVQTQSFKRWYDRQGTRQPPSVPGRVKHHPLSATDFRPARPGHPRIEELLAASGMSPDTQARVRKVAEITFQTIARRRENNIATAMLALFVAAKTMLREPLPAAQVEEALLSLNDELATWPRFAAASADEKQNTYDSLIFVMTVLVTYNDVGARDQITHDAGVALAGKVVRTLAGEPKAH